MAVDSSIRSAPREEGRSGRRSRQFLRRRGDDPSETPAYGSWILGKPSESQQRRRVRIQLILTVFVIVANLLGIGVSLLVVIVAIPDPDMFAPPIGPIGVAVDAIYVCAALVVGWVWATRRILRDLQWAIEERPPTAQDQRNTLLAPWRLTMIPIVLWTVGTVLLTVLYGSADPAYVPKFLFGISFSGIVVSASCYFFAEFALRPAAAQALEAGRPAERLAPGVMGRIVVSWLLGSGVPVLGIAVVAAFTLVLRNMTITQFAFAVLFLALAALIFGFILLIIAAWLTVTPVRVAGAALGRVEQGDLDCELVVFDGTELGALQHGFNAMVEGLRQRERIRDLFGRHVGREVAAAAEDQEVELGGEERHVAVLFVDIIGSTTIAEERSPSDVVALLNRFFSVIIEEVNSRRGLVNKFEGDALLAIFGAPVHADSPETDALSAARAIARRLDAEVPECPAGIGVSAGEVVAGNVGADERFEYTVIGDPVNQAARISELAKSAPQHILASADAVDASDDDEKPHWQHHDEVTLRGRKQPTKLAGLGSHDHPHARG